MKVAEIAVKGREGDFSIWTVPHIIRPKGIIRQKKKKKKKKEKNKRKEKKNRSIPLRGRDDRLTSISQPIWGGGRGYRSV